MRLPLALVLLLVATVLAVVWGLGVLPGGDVVAPSRPATAPASRPSSGPRATPLPSQSGDEAPVVTTARPTRDLFRYASASTAPAPMRVSAAPASVPSATPPPVTPPVRLLGFVHRAGRLAAVLQVEGDLVVAEAGQPVGRFTLLALDEDTGARLRATTGEELHLRRAD